MGTTVSYGSVWTAAEVDAVITVYFEMLQQEQLERPYVKAEYNRQLQELTGRTKQSIEFKFANISAVLRKLGRRWVRGYQPRANYQGLLLDEIDRRLGDWENATLSSGFAEVGGPDLPSNLEYVPAPHSEMTSEISSERLDRLIRKFDPAARDARNRLLGRRGEELVFQQEIIRLRDRRPDLVRKVRWVSQNLGDGAGYDIRSYDFEGRERLLEVKTTVGYERTPFYLSANEYDLSLERPQEFRIVRVFDFSHKPTAFELIPPFSDKLTLSPQTYRAQLL